MPVDRDVDPGVSRSVEFTLRPPRADDGAEVTRLIARSPPLDANSAYCNLLQCSHFADTCVVAEYEGRMSGWVSAYRPPTAPDELFIWQVAVDAAARGRGLAGIMLDSLLAREAARGVQILTTTITETNLASWALFEGFARKRGLTLERSVAFDRQIHFAGAHDTEFLATIGPLHERSATDKKEDL